MKKIETIEELNYVCDECWKEMVIPYIYFDLIDDKQMRVIEHKRNTLNRNLTYWRKEVDLCSVDCWKKYLWKSIENLLWEIVKW